MRNINGGGVLLSCFVWYNLKVIITLAIFVHLFYTRFNSIINAG